MANISSQSTRASGRAGNYAKKDPVAISAIGAPVATFEEHLHANRVVHGKDGVRPVQMVDGEGAPVVDEKGAPIPARDTAGRIIYESRYVQAYALVESFGHDELDPDDPESWSKAQECGRAVVEGQFPGHMALISTEVNGRSGCVHNHIILDAINAETGKSLDTNRLTHARLAVEHDRILAEHGHIQREDMRRAVEEAQEQMAEAAAEVREKYDGRISESRLQRKITAAENKVTVRRTSTLTASEQREQRRTREYDRYMLNEQTRAAQTDIGLHPVAERFSEIVLESRIRESLDDPRARTWETLEDVGRENGVMIARRGADVSYGMMLADSAGDLAEPARAHRRRGKGLGEGFRVEDVEARLQSNKSLETTREGQSRAQDADHLARLSGVSDEEVNAMVSDYLDDIESLSSLGVEVSTVFKPDLGDVAPEPEPSPHRVNPSAEKIPDGGRGVEHEVDEETPKAEIEEEEPFRSRLHGVKAKTGAAKVQKRIDTLAEMEDRWHERMPQTPEERAQFEREFLKGGGMGPRMLDTYGEYMEPRMHEVLVERQKFVDRANKAYSMDKKNEIRGERMNGDYLLPREELDRRQQERVDALRKDRDARVANLRTADPNKAAIDALHDRVAEARATVRQDAQSRETSRDNDQDYGLGD